MWAQSRGGVWEHDGYRAEVYVEDGVLQARSLDTKRPVPVFQMLMGRKVGPRLPADA